MSIFMLAADVLSREPQGAVGDWAAHSDFDRWSTGWNAYPQAKQVTTVTVTDQGDGDDVIITITPPGGSAVNVSINTGTGADLATIGAALAAAINAEPLIRGSVIATFDTATLTLTGIIPGEAFTVSIASDPDSVLSAVTAVVTPDTADPIPVGRAVVSQGYDTGEPEERVALPLAALFTAQVATLAFGAFVSGQVNTIAVYEMAGNERVRQLAYVSEAAATDRDTTVDALIDLLEAQFPANSVVATADNATATAIIFTAEKPGLEFVVEFLAGHEGATLQSLTLTNTTGPSIATSLWRAFAGVSMRMLDEEAVSAAALTWPANGGVRVAREGKLFVESAETPVMGGIVYVETASGANTGKLYAAVSATRLPLPRNLAAWERDGRDTTLAVVRLNVP